MVVRFVAPQMRMQSPIFRLNMRFCLKLPQGVYDMSMNDTSTFVGHLVSSVKEREKRDRRDSRGDGRDGTGEKRKWMTVKKQKK